MLLKRGKKINGIWDVLCPERKFFLANGSDIKCLWCILASSLLYFLHNTTCRDFSQRINRLPWNTAFSFSKYYRVVELIGILLTIDREVVIIYFGTISRIAYYVINITKRCIIPKYINTICLACIMLLVWILKGMYVEVYGCVQKEERKGRNDVIILKK